MDGHQQGPLELVAIALRSGDPLQLALAGYLARYRGQTFRSYRQCLREYCGWCQSRGMSPLLIGRAHLEVWMREQELAGAGAATINRKFATIAGFYKFAVIDEHIDRDPSLHVLRPKIHEDAQRRTFLTPLQFAAFLQAARAAGTKQYAIAALFGMSGLRVGELCSLDVASMSLFQGHDVLSFIGKGRKPAQIPLPIPVIHALRAYLAGREDGPMFLNEHGRRLTIDNATLIVKNTAKAAHIDPKLVSPHSLRRTFCTAGLIQGVPLRDMQIAMRHADPRTTSRYDMAKNNMDRHASHRVASYLAGMA
jgi:site-specific recombinase XerD